MGLYFLSIRKDVREIFVSIVSIEGTPGKWTAMKGGINLVRVKSFHFVICNPCLVIFPFLSLPILIAFCFPISYPAIKSILLSHHNSNLISTAYLRLHPFRLSLVYAKTPSHKFPASASPSWLSSVNLTIPLLPAVESRRFTGFFHSRCFVYANTFVKGQKHHIIPHDLTRTNCHTSRSCAVNHF